MAVVEYLPITNRPLGELIPAELDGRRGALRNRSGVCLLSADTDPQAVHEWLRQYDNDNTLAFYNKEVRRLLVWLTEERGKPLSSMMLEDWADYVRFLEQPTRARSPRARASLRSGLSAASIRQSRAAIASLFQFLVNAGYLVNNPLKLARLSRKRETPALAVKVERRLNPDMLRAVRETIDALEVQLVDGPLDLRAQRKVARQRFALEMLYSTVTRASELCAARTSDLRVWRERGQTILVLQVMGKGSRERAIPLTARVQSVMRDYFGHFGLPDLVTAALSGVPMGSRSFPDVPLLQPLAFRRADKGVTRSALWRIVVEVFEAAAGRIAARDPVQAARLREASTHWMRHTGLTDFLERGGDLRVARNFAGHKGFDTLSTYIHADVSEIHAQLVRGGF
ncbi:MAG: tyrosine-type recombinase/integrase [Pseudomonadota bacterium]